MPNVAQQESGGGRIGTQEFILLTDKKLRLREGKPRSQGHTADERARLGYLTLISGHQSAFLSQGMGRNGTDRLYGYNDRVRSENTQLLLQDGHRLFVSHPGEMMEGWGPDFQHTKYYANWLKGHDCIKFQKL